MPEIDLHGKTYFEVSEALINELHLLDLPIKVITGNSSKMKQLVKSILTDNKYSFKFDDIYNQGYINVIGYDES